MNRQNGFVMVLCIIFFFSSCTITSLLGLGGDSEEAVNRRHQFTNSLLDSCSPEGCGYSSIKGKFGWCKKDVTKINKRVDISRAMILAYLAKDPSAKNTEIFDRIILEDLYYCRDESGDRLPQGSVIMYCETKLSTNLERKFSGNHIEYLGQINGLFKYKIEME